MTGRKNKKKSNLAIDVLLQKAISAHERGQLDNAVSMYNDILETKQDHSHANHNLGVILVQKGNLLEAIKRFEVALTSQPKIPQFWYSLIDAHYRNAEVTLAWELLQQATKFGASGRVFAEMSNKIQKSLPNELLNIDVDDDDTYDLTSISELINSKRFVEAEENVQKLLSREPKSARLLNLQGVISFECNQIEKSIEYLRRAISENEEFPLAHYNLGNSFRKKGELKKAGKCYKKAIALDCKFSEAFFNLGNVYFDLGELSNAHSSYDSACKINPEFYLAWNSRGLLFYKQKELQPAFEHFKRAIELKPDFADAYFNLGNLHSDVKRYDLATECYRLALKYDPQHIDTMINTGTLHFNNGDCVKALEFYNSALNLDNANTAAKICVGAVYNHLGQPRRAIDYYKSAIRSDPRNHAAYLNLGVSYKNCNDITSARDSYKKAIELKEDFAEAHRHLSVITDYNEFEQHLVQLESLNESEKISLYDLVQIKFALAKAYEDLGRDSHAFRCYEEGNQLRKKLSNYEIDQDINYFKKIREKQKQLESVYEIEALITEKVVRPIFIIGMPRSGTTLLEQILSRHRDIQAGGELDFTAQYYSGLIYNGAEITQNHIARFRKEYLDTVKSLACGQRYLVDKMPHNFLYLPFILKAIPEALIIHSKRDSRAVCWSNFKTYFTSPGLGYACDLDDIVDYYNLYTDLMCTWEGKFKNRIISCDYEKLVRNPNQEIQQLLERLEIEWDANCLFPEKNERPVNTASQQQVRKRVYSGSSDTWKKFQKFIGAKFDPLN